MTVTKQRRYDDDEQNVFDERGTLLRGKIRVPLTLMDSLGRAIAREGELAGSNCTTHDAAGFEPGTRPGFVFSDAGRSYDHYGDYERQVTDAWKQRDDDGRLQGDAVRPEPRKAMTVEEANAAYEADLISAWKLPDRAKQFSPPTTDAMTKDQAYESYEKDLQDAWRGDQR